MENKYFTPDIEDLCIGYECEYNFARAYTDEFHFVKIGYKNVTPGKGGYTNELTDMIHLIDDGAAAIRVSYLTKEQIEAEGWKHIGGKMLSGAEQIYNKGIFNLYYTTSNLKLQVVNDEEDWSPEVQGGVKFEGFCKDINTFKKIIKLLGI